MVDLEKATVKSLFKNNRYRVIHTNSNYYLIDGDHSILGYLFFAFNWLIPQKAYAITERDADDLIVNRLNVKKQNSLNLFGIGFIMIVFALFIPKIFQYFDKSSATFGDLRRIGDIYFVMPSTTFILFLLVSIVAPAVLLRVCLSIRAKKRLLETVDIDKLPVVEINILPNSVSIVLKTIGVYIFFGFLLFSSAYLMIILSGYWIISLSLMIIFLLFSLTNLLSFIPGDFGRYLCKVQL
ncbi:DUF443 family protein [Sporosarcina sp. 6E9]|uniref:DUF443 family protein n=1 Tax=Sporosarcina sp. 6E9 TaxID=2819235 RepID=UPI0034CFDC69